MSARDKENPLLKIVERKEAEAAAAAPSLSPPPEPVRRREKPAAVPKPSRIGTRLVGAHLPPSFSKQLNILAAEEEVTVRDLLAEAINDLFVKKGKKRIT